MPAITSSSNAIIEVNKALQSVLQQYLDPESSSGIDIRFDLPDVNSIQSTPTISVFLYDVHEDLQLRQSEPIRLNVNTSMLRAGWVNLSCNYLITYWEAQSTASDGSGPDSSPDNQAAQVMTRTLQALLNNRELSGIAGAYSRIIPPQENLNSLGNFWQALGNRPRLSLMYSVTVPILLDNSIPQTLVKTVSSQVSQTATVDMRALDALLRQELSLALGDNGAQKLARVNVKSQQAATENADASGIAINVEVSGMTDKANQDNLNLVFKKWSDDQSAVTEINGTAVNILELQTHALVYL